MSKLLKVKPVKELLSWLKLLVSIKFKLSAVTVPELEISSAKLVTSIVKVSATIAPELLKSTPAVILRLSASIVVLLIKSRPA